MDGNGGQIPFEEQERSLWDPALISQGKEIIDGILPRRQIGPYIIQAAIADLHMSAPRFEETDWEQIVMLYDSLYSLVGGPVVLLNRTIAGAFRDGFEEGVSRLEHFIGSGVFTDYAAAHIALGELLRRLGRESEAAERFQTALALGISPAEARFANCRLTSFLLPSRP